MTIVPASPLKKIPVAAWVYLAALAAGVWPWFSNLRDFFGMDSESIRWAFDYSNGISANQLGYSDFVILPFAEPTVVIAGLVLVLVVKNKSVRALPGLMYFAGFLLFLVLNLMSMKTLGLPISNAWTWTVGQMPQALLYVASLLLALAAAIIALAEKGPAGSVASSVQPGFAGQSSNAGRTPVAFDTQTGRPIYGYDVNTGEPIF